MSITTYAELRAAIADWLARPGDATIAGIAPDLIRLAEARINHGAAHPPFVSAPLRAPQMETRVVLPLDGDDAALPADCLEIRALTLQGASPRALAYVTPQHFASLPRGGAGMPRFFTTVGDTLRVAPAAAAGLTAELLYVAAVPALSDANPTNWLLAASPGIYLYGALLEAQPYIGNDDRVAQWAAMFGAALDALQATARRARAGTAPLIMRPAGEAP